MTTLRIVSILRRSSIRPSDGSAFCRIASAYLAYRNYNKPALAAYALALRAN